jgi:hypothetical protein
MVENHSREIEQLGEEIRKKDRELQKVNEKI